VKSTAQPNPRLQLTGAPVLSSAHVLIAAGVQRNVGFEMRASRPQLKRRSLYASGKYWHHQSSVGRKDMTLKRMDNVLIVVEDLEAAKAFFVELGMELEGEMPVEGRWVDRVVGLENVRCEIAMMRTPDGHGRLELDKFHAPAAVRAEPRNAPVNTLGIRRIMFAVDDIEDVLARLRAHGAELIGEVTQYEDTYRLCYIRGPEGIIVALAEQLG
jgi:catechol 2,3-dioxygenase-like lactoylglutathione lyase family enzyme